MPSTSLAHWRTIRSTELDEMENAHQAVASSGPGRRYATLQINHAYAMLLSSQFQGFCRDLHSQAVDIIVNSQPAAMQTLLRANLMFGRKLDTGNPNPGNLGSDFNRFGLKFWDEVKAHDGHAQSRKDRLELLNDWRNAIAHQDFSKVGGKTLYLGTVKQWRSALNGLGATFDRVIGDHLGNLVGSAPW